MNKIKGELPVVGKMSPLTNRAALAQRCLAGQGSATSIDQSINQFDQSVNFQFFIATPCRTTI